MTGGYTPPYAHLNLTRNPFGEFDEQWRVEVALVDVSPWLESLQDPRHVVQFVGEKGRGKTTCLLALRRALGADCAYVHLSESERHRLPGNAGRLLIDEAQRLGRWERRRWYVRPALRGIGTHADDTGLLVRLGRIVTTVDVPIAFSDQRLVEMVTRRIEACRGSAGPLPCLDVDQARRLITCFGTNIRGMFSRLYDRVQQQTTPGPIQVD